ncbi:Oidioi.mRNA.OKI2018_I69.chr1.g2088.t1.cds [Oikopleura dioica]|uniref:Oidioi.mRNA.OKI2018_I69.chr1.g2088.t1.cds n=1 Tax=Oikopleura dioica TaxID=34765 RepID=A0ABN7SQI6_OIKDI|nr:Oidioi.mRNA.OKI2018_I69.chr1.g2088.t1.cds [Oikopleura dioica]
MKVFAALSAVALAQDVRQMSSHERLDSVSENINTWIDTYISDHNRVNKYRDQFTNLVNYLDAKLDMQCAGENQDEVEQLAADDAIVELGAEERSESE